MQITASLHISSLIIAISSCNGLNGCCCASQLQATPFDERISATHDGECQCVCTAFAVACLATATAPVSHHLRIYCYQSAENKEYKHSYCLQILTLFFALLILLVAASFSCHTYYFMCDVYCCCCALLFAVARFSCCFSNSSFYISFVFHISKIQIGHVRLLVYIYAVLLSWRWVYEW